MQTVRKSRSDRRRKALLAATEVFLEKGYDGTSMDIVAATAAVSKPTLYKYFSGKERLFAEIVSFAISEHEEFASLFPKSIAGKTSVESEFQLLAGQLIDALLQPRILRLLRLVVANSERFPEASRFCYKQGFERALATMAERMKELADRELVNVKDPLLAANHFLGMLLWLPMSNALLSGDYRPNAEERELYIVTSVRTFLAVYGPTSRPADDICGAGRIDHNSRDQPLTRRRHSMKLYEPSRTAIMVARQRAAHQVLERGTIFSDPFALKILGEDETDVIQFANRHPMASFGRLFTTARSVIAEEALSKAVERGVRQIVILGAGLDTFSLRNPHGTHGTRIYEVDHPATQAWKRERLAEAQITLPPSMVFVPVDFERDQLGEKLVAAGFQTNSPAFFTWLGVVPYLTREAIDSTLNYMSSIRSAEVVFDYMEPAQAFSEELRQVEKERTEQLEKMGERSVSRFGPTDIAAILSSHGFHTIEDTNFQEIVHRFGGAIQGLTSGHLAVHVVYARQ